MNALNNIVIDLKPVEEKLDQSTTEILNAVSNIDFSPVEEKVDEIKTVVESIDGNATINKEEILTALNNAKIALQGNDVSTTLTSLKTAIENIDIDTSDLAKEDTLTTCVTNIRSDIGSVKSDTTDIKTGLQSVAQESTLSNGITNVRSDIGSLSTNVSSIGLNVTGIKDDLDDLAKQGSNSAVTLTEVSEKINNINSGVPQISIPDSGSAETVELSANTLYVFSNRTSDLTLTLGNPVQGEVSEYHFIIEVGSTLPTITLPTGLTWKSSNTVTFDTNTTYEVSILDNYAIFVVW